MVKKGKPVALLFWGDMWCATNAVVLHALCPPPPPPPLGRPAPARTATSLRGYPQHPRVH